MPKHTAKKSASEADSDDAMQTSGEEDVTSGVTPSMADSTCT